MKIEKEKRLKMKRTDHCQGAQQRIVNKILEMIVMKREKRRSMNEVKISISKPRMR